MNGAHVLTWVAFLPMAGALLITVLPVRVARQAGLAFSLAAFAASLELWFGFDPVRHGFQFRETVSWVPELGIRYAVGIDGISLLLVLLTTLLTPVALLFSYRHVKDNVRGFVASFLLLETGMIGSLVALDMALFYVFWEVMLVPMYFIIGIWGGKRRIYAAVKFFLFTMAGSLLMFVAILFLAIRQHAVAGVWSFSYEDFRHLTFAPGTERLLFLAFALAFLIKIPLFPLHTWLPDAHTEAPTGGSIVLAGVLLKLGVYGYLRFAIPFFPHASMAFAPALALLSTIGVIYGSLVAFAQKDIKRLVAYSSVAHLGLVMLGVAAASEVALAGAVLQSVNHGLSTGALFLLVGVLYERRHTRESDAYGGVARIMPITATLFLIATFSSVGLPGLNGFVGEFLILVGSFPTLRTLTVIATSGMILSALYLLTLNQRVFWGPPRHAENEGLSDISGSEFTAAAALIVFIVWIGVAPNTFLRPLRTSIQDLTGSASSGGGNLARLTR